MTAPAYELDGIAAALRAERLRPIIDPVLHLVRAECPDCRAGENDPLGMYRPLAVVPRRRGTTALCDACGATGNA